MRTTKKTIRRSPRKRGAGGKEDFAGEIHDGICQELSAILFLTKCVEQKLRQADKPDENLLGLVGKIEGAAGRSIEKAQALVKKIS